MSASACAVVLISNSDLRDPVLAKTLAFCAVDSASFGGWHMTYWEFLKMGIDPFAHFKRFAALRCLV